MKIIVIIKEIYKMEIEYTQVNNCYKLYIITREDLAPGIQLAQSIHAAIQFCLEHNLIVNEWYNNSNYIAILAAKDEKDLLLFCDKLVKKGIVFSAFKEPDFDNELTAVALEPGDKSRRATSSFPLALKERKEK